MQQWLGEMLCEQRLPVKYELLKLKYYLLHFSYPGSLEVYKYFFTAATLGPLTNIIILYARQKKMRHVMLREAKEQILQFFLQRRWNCKN